MLSKSCCCVSAMSCHGVDPWVSRLEQQVWGLNVMAYPLGSTGHHFAEIYRSLMLEGRKLFPWAHLYDTCHLHITLGPPSLFTRHTAPLDESLRLQFESLWVAKLADWAKSAGAGWPRSRPLVLRYSKMRLDKAAAIFLIDDSDGVVANIRLGLQRISDEICAMNSQFPAVTLPNIVHTTFLRFHTQPDVPDEELDRRFGLLRQMWEAAGEEATTIKAEKLVLIREVRPYLHNQPEGQVLGEFEYGRDEKE